MESTTGKDITFPKAMQQLQDGLDVLRKDPPPGQKSLGLVPSEVTATFGVTATAGGDLKLNLSPNLGSLGSAGINTDNSQSIQRVNTVTVKMVNVFIDKNGAWKPIPGSHPVAPGMY